MLNRFGLVSADGVSVQSEAAGLLDSVRKSSPIETVRIVPVDIAAVIAFLASDNSKYMVK